MNFTTSITLMFRDAFSAGFQQVESSLAGMEGALEQINQNSEMNRMAADLSMMTAATAPMRDALAQALDAPAQLAGTLESSLVNIQAVTGSTAEEMAGLRRELLAIGGSAVAGPAAVTAAYYDVASGVTDASARLATLEASVALAEAGQADLGAATGGLIKVMNAYGFTADQAGFAADVFTATVGKGVGSMDEFVAAMSPIAGLTASVGVGFDEVGAGMAYITSKGQTASAAGTQLRAAITSLLNPNQTLNTLLGEMGVESGSAMLEQYGLAESLSMINEALGGSQDAMARALGSTEALQGAIALTQAGFEEFSASYMGGLDGITEQARAVQLESIEAKAARLQAVTDSLQAQIGTDVNKIRGFFMDVKTGFLERVVAPIIDSSVGEAFSSVAAGVGMGARAVLSVGSGALETASQLAVLTTNIKNAGGFANLFKNSLSLLGAPFRAIGTMARSFGTRLFGIGGASAAASAGTGTYGVTAGASTGAVGAATTATTAFGTSLWAALGPILLVVAAIAAVIAVGYLIVKNWDKIGAFFGRLWEGMKAVFSRVWDAVKAAIAAVGAFFADAWERARSVFVGVWEAIRGFFQGVWNGITSTIAGIGAFFSGIWNGVVSIFTGVWDRIRGVLEGFISWVGGIVERILAPFRAIGDGVRSVVSGVTDVVGGIRDRVGGALSRVGDFVGGLFGRGEGEAAGEGLTTALATGIRSGAGAPAAALGDALVGVDAMLPHSDAQEGPLSRLTQSGRALTETFAQGIDAAPLEERAEDAFGAAAPPAGAHAPQPLVATKPQNQGATTIHIHELILQADDTASLLDFVRQLEHAVHRPTEVAA